VDNMYEDDNKKERNRQSAVRYRQRRKVYVDSLEVKVKELTDDCHTKDNEIAALASENRQLKEQLGFIQKLVNFAAAKSSSSSSSSSEGDDGSEISVMSSYDEESHQHHHHHHKTADEQKKRTGVMLLALFAVLFVVTGMKAIDYGLFMDSSWFNDPSVMAAAAVTTATSSKSSPLSRSLMSYEINSTTVNMVLEAVKEIEPELASIIESTMEMYGGEPVKMEMTTLDSDEKSVFHEFNSGGEESSSDTGGERHSSSEVSREALIEMLGVLRQVERAEYNSA